MKYLLAITLALVTGSAHAIPNQLEVAGIVPGVTTQKEFENGKAEYGYIIGGFKLICSPKYDVESVLDELFCFTGNEYYSRDITKESRPVVTNLEVHATLVKGFTKKFGKPVEVIDMPVQTGFGVKYNTNSVKWKDKIGNELTLIDMATKVGVGLLILTSAKKLKLEKEKEEEGEKLREF